MERYHRLGLLSLLALAPIALLVALPLATTSDVDWPAWVQAIGSVLAILTAVVLARWDDARQRQQRHSSETAFMAFVLAETGRAEGLMETALDGLTEKDSIWSPGEQIQNAIKYTKEGKEVLQKFSEMPLAQWPSYRVASAFYELLPAYRGMVAELKERSADLVNDPKARSDVRAFHRALVGQLIFVLRERAREWQRQDLAGRG